MSFRGLHNQYSPYYQPLEIEQDVPEAGNSTATTCQPPSYHPLSAYQSRVPQPTTQNASTPSAFFGDQRSGNPNVAGASTPYDGRNGYGDERSQVNTSSLVNLAYASSLSRPKSVPQQGYSQEGSGQYEPNAAASVSRDGESRTGLGLPIDPSRRLPPTHTRYSSQNLNINTGRSSPAQPQYSITNPSQQPNRQFMPPHAVQEPANPRSGRDNVQPTSRNLVDSKSTPRFFPTQGSSFQPPSHPNGSRQGHSRNLPKNNNIDSPRAATFTDNFQPSIQTQSLVSGQIAGTPFGPPNGPQQNILTNQRIKVSDSHHPPPLDNTSSMHQKSPPSNVHAQIQSQQSQQSIPVQEHYPKTVDPSQVFDDIEYRRRQDEENERRQTAEVAAQSARAAALQVDKHFVQNGQTGDLGLHIKSPQFNDIPELGAGTTAEGQKESESIAKDRMELEMKQMIEKMRDYRAKDPSLFSQIWKQVKKGQQPPASSTKPIAQESSASPVVPNEQLNNPILDDNMVDASSFPPDFDRGRFPYQRRRRGGLAGTVLRDSKSHRKMPVGAPEQTPNVSSPGFSADPLSQQTSHATAQTAKRPSREKATKSTPQVSAASMATPMPAAVSPPAAPPTVTVAHMVMDKSNDTDQRLLAAMRTFHETIPSPSQSSVRKDMPPNSAWNPSISAPSKPTPPAPVQNAGPITKYFHGKTTWPESKKRELGEAAVDFLKRNPANVTKSITAAEIHSLLDQNPAYTEMCDILSYRGFVVDRGNFARFLLHAVPDLGNSSTTSLPVAPATSVPTASVQKQTTSPSKRPLIGQHRPAGNQNNPIQNTHGSATGGNTTRGKKLQELPAGNQNPFSHNSQRPPAANHYNNEHSMQNAHVGTQNLTGPDAHRHLNGRPLTDSQRIYTSDRVFPGTPVATEKPLTKEDKARKRTFSDIVDLTQDLSEEEDISHHQKSKPPEDRRDAAVDPAKMTISRKKDRAAPSATSRMANQEIRNSSTAREHMFKEHVAEPMNKRRDARRCSSYDPKTIARDILISSGRHPTMAPLNYHLDILRENFDSVNHDTDLSTFKWDIVDPPDKQTLENESMPRSLNDIMNKNRAHIVLGDQGDALDLMTKSVGKHSNPRRGRPRKYVIDDTIGSVDGMRPEDSRQNDRTALPHPGHATIGPALGKFHLPREAHSVGSDATRTERPLGSIKQPQITNKAGMIVQRSTPTTTVPFNEAFSAASAAVPLHPLSHVLPTPGARCLRCRKQHSVCNGQKPCNRCATVGIEAEHCIFDESKRGNIAPNLGQRKLGRPAGTKNSKERSDKNIPKGPRAPSVLLSGRFGSFSSGESSPSLGRGSENVISPSRNIAVVIPQLSPNVKVSGIQHQGAKRDGAEVKNEAYKSYKCNWHECPAELHNLETLHKHVQKHHKGTDAPIPCKMLGCARSPDGDGGETWPMFEDEEAWTKHVEQEHIRLVAKNQREVLSVDSEKDTG